MSQTDQGGGPQPPGRIEQGTPTAASAHYAEQHRRDTQEQQYRRESLSTYRAGVKVQVITLITLGFYTLFTAWMAYSTRNAAIATKESADAAAKAAEADSATLRATRRAWIVADGVMFTDPGSGLTTEPFQVTTKFRNVGAGPALHAAFHVVWRPYTGTLPDKPPYPATTGIMSQGIIGPGREFSSDTSAGTLSEYELEQITKGTGFLYAYGWVDYSDEFGDWHGTTYCFMHQAGRRFVFCPTYNEVY